MQHFRIQGNDYGIQQWGGVVFDEYARRVQFSLLGLHRGERFRYEYDFTAGLKLDIRLEQILPSGPGRPIDLRHPI